MALFNVLFDIAAKTAAFEASMTRIERRFDQIGDYAKKAGAAMGIAFGAEMFREGLLGAIELGDEMGKLADKTGLTASAASELSRVFKQNDLDNEKLTMAFRNMQVEIGKGGDAFKKWGVNITELRQQRPDQQFETLAQRVSDLTDENERAAAAADFFGKKVGPDLLPLLNQGKDGIEALRKELGGLSQEDIQRLQEADDAIKKLGFLKEDFWNRLAVGASLLAEKIGLISQSPKSQLTEDFQKAGELIAKYQDQLVALNTRKANGALGLGNIDSDIKVVEDKMRAEQKIADDLWAQIQKLDGAAAKPKSIFFSPTDLDSLARSISNVKGQYVQVFNEFEQNAKWLEENGRTLKNFQDDMLDAANKATEFWAGAGKAVEDAAASVEVKVLPALKKSSDEIKPWAQELNRSMTSAFSDAFYNIGNGANSFADDMINAFKRVLANQATAELFDMLASFGGKVKDQNEGSNSFWSSVGGYLMGVFGGSRDVGGRGESGKGYLIGRGAQPEMFWPDSAGTFIPNAALAGGGNISFSPNYSIDARGATVDAVKLLPSVIKQAHDAAVATMLDMRRRGKY